MSKDLHSHALVIFSGGQDSTTCLYWAKKFYDKVTAITFSYGQKHSIEVEASKKICELAEVPQLIYPIDFSAVTESNLLSHGDVNTLNEKGLPSSFVPNRNQLFITLAHAFAQKIGASALVTGVCETDYSGYPDCRREFINAIEKASNLGSDSEIIIQTPLMHLTKADTFLLAQSLGCLDVVINFSNTCYNGNQTANAWGKGCGECPACKLREAGYKEFSEHRSSL